MPGAGLASPFLSPWSLDVYHPEDAAAMTRMIGLATIAEPKLEKVYEEALRMFHRGGRSGSFAEEPGGLAALAVLLAMNGFHPPKEAAPSGFTDWRLVSSGTRVMICTREQERYRGEFLKVVGVGRLEVRVDGMTSLREFRSIEVQVDRGQVFNGPPIPAGFKSTPFDAEVAGKVHEFDSGQKVLVTIDDVVSTATFMQYGPRNGWATINHQGDPRPICLKQLSKLPADWRPLAEETSEAVEQLSEALS